MINLLLLHELLSWLKFYQLLKNDQRRGIGIIYERNGRLSEKIELVPKMIVRHMPSILSVLTDGSCTLFLNFSSFVRRDRDPRENSEKDVQGGGEAIRSNPRAFTGCSYSSTRRVESSAIVQNRGILMRASSKKIKTPRRRRQSCPADWSSPQATLPLCAIRLVPEIYFRRMIKLMRTACWLKSDFIYF